MLGRRMLSFKPRLSQVRSLLKRSNKFGNSIILFQDGHWVQELPVLVRHTSDHSFIMQNFGLDGTDNLAAQKNGHSASQNTVEGPAAAESKNQRISVTDDEKEFVFALARIERSRHIYSLLETATIGGITPFVALKALVRIAQLEGREEDSEPERNFARQALVQKLMHTILEGNDNETLVNTFMFMKELQPQGSLSELWEELRKGCIDKAASGELTISQTVRMVKGLDSVDGPRSNIADQLWQGITNNASDINESNVADVCAVLPLLKKSSRVVFRTVLQRLPHFWWKLSPPEACRLVDAVYVARQDSRELCRILARWTSLALHQLTEPQMRALLAFFQSAEHCDDALQRAVEKYCLARGPTAAPATVAAIAGFARHFNIRSEPLLQTVSDHFVQHESRYGAESDSPPAEFRLLRDAPAPPADVTAVVRAIGELDFAPKNSLGFFAAVEAQLMRRFDEFAPEDVLDLCLACVYLKRYPINVTHQVFNLFFLERLSGADGIAPRLRTKLAMLDSALTLDCAGYRGPMLQRDMSAHSVQCDRRAEKLARHLLPHLSAIDGVRRAERGEPLPQLPLHHLYIPQLVCQRADGRRLCLYLNGPELYSRTGQRPLGAVQLRRRLLGKLNLLAVDLPLLQMAPLVVHPALLRQQLTQAVADAH